MKKVFIATPTGEDRATDVIRNEQSTMQLYARRALKDDQPEFVQSWFQSYEPGANVRHKALDASCLKQEKLAESDCAFFGYGWDKDNECLLLKDACDQYSIPHVAIVGSETIDNLEFDGAPQVFCAVPMTNRSDADVSEDVSTLQCYARVALSGAQFVQSNIPSTTMVGNNARCRELAVVNLLRRKLATAHVAIFGLGWSDCPMCCLLKAACEQYGIPHYTAISFHMQALEGEVA